MLAAHKWGALALVFASIAVAVFSLGANPPSVPPELGRRGLKRARALASNALLAVFEPWLRLIAGWIAFLPLAKTRAKLELRLRHAGDWLGLTPDEVVAFGLLTSATAIGAGVALTRQAGFPDEFAIFFGLVGWTVPTSRLGRAVTERLRTIARTLPGAIDLVAMCMAAGLDFPGSVRKIVEKTPARGSPLREELEYVLQELELGRTRRQALEGFAERAPSEAVRDFVAAVVQSEEKGNPLAVTLRVQANMLRMRRSVRAEEDAAKAGVRMIIPLMLIFVTIMIMLVGPSLMQIAETGLTGVGGGAF